MWENKPTGASSAMVEQTRVVVRKVGYNVDLQLFLFNQMSEGRNSFSKSSAWGRNSGALVRLEMQRQ